MPEYMDGDAVQEGVYACDWSVHIYYLDEGIKYSWVATTVGGGYRDSDELFDSVDEAMRDLGVR